MKKNRILIGALFISILLAGCGMPGYQTWQVETLPVETRGADEATLSLQQLEEQARESILWEDCYAYAFSQLTDAEQIWYRNIADALGIMAKDVKLSEEGLELGLDETCVDRVFQAVLIDHPELFYVEGYSYTKYTLSDRLISIEFSGTYSISWDEAGERAEEIAEKAEEIIQKAPVDSDDYAKVKYVYDTLILNTDYDREASDNQNVYSVFVGKASVCQGYAKAFQYLMERMGIECTLVQGEVTESGEGHAWNLVKADGDFYYVDVTWGDISYRSAEKNREAEEESEQLMDLPEWISYDYFCITTEQLLRTHLPDDVMALPECNTMADNYYVRENAYFEQYDKENLKELVVRRIQEGQQTAGGNIMISLCCAEKECYEEFCTRLLDTQELFRYLEGTGIKTFIYSCDDKQFTLTFFMVTTPQ